MKAVGKRVTQPQIRAFRKRGGLESGLRCGEEGMVCVQEVVGAMRVKENIKDVECETQGGSEGTPAWREGEEEERSKEKTLLLPPPLVQLVSARCPCPASPSI